MGNVLTKLRKNVADNDAIFGTVITDSYENGSKEYTANSIKALVESLKAKGWILELV